jgi:hypothetical protein
VEDSIPLTGWRFKAFVAAVEDYIRRRSPQVFCPSCLASMYEVDDKVIRKALSSILSQPGFKNTQGVCCGCVRSDDIIEWNPQ